MIPEWLKELQNEKNNQEFSELCHYYYKLAAMRIMQTIREKHKVPKEDLPDLTLSIFSRMLNESCYAVGCNIRDDYPITHFFHKKHLLNLVRVLNGEKIIQEDRDDIETDINIGLKKFKEFILENGKDFYI